MSSYLSAISYPAAIQLTVVARYSPLLATLAFASPLQAAAGGEARAAVDETVIVVGTRTERALSDTAATVSLRTAEDIQREITRDIADLVRFEPGVSVGGTGSRFGLDGFNIRGIGGNRVLTVVDNIRVSEEFSFGPFLNARRDFIDVDSIDRAEIGRGPISALYGSDALGGVVAIKTLDPDDLVSNDDPLYASFRTGYSSADESLVGTGTVAFGTDRLAGMLTYTQRDGQETNTFGGFGGLGPTREQPDPADIATTNVSAKVSFKPAEGHELLVSLFQFDSESQSQVLSDANTVARGVLLNERNVDDRRERRGWSLDYRYDGEALGLDEVHLKIYQQTSETSQLTVDERLSFRSGPQTRDRNSLFEQEIDGFYGQLGKAFNTGPASHYLTFGVDAFRTDNVSLRNGATVDVLGNPVREFFPFPTRDFPTTEVNQIAVFLQDEISLFNDRLLLSPGVRFDRFEADSTADEIYLTGNPGSPLPEDYQDSEVTFKFGAVYKFTEAFSVFGRYSEGFRAPPYDDVNVGFTNFIGGYKTIAAANLESETSRGFEFGARWLSRGLALGASVYRNDYENFIESQALAPSFASRGGIDPADGLLTFQSINRAEVEISGYELTADVQLGEFVAALQGVRVRAALAYADGEDTDRNQPLNTVEPLNGVLGLGYDAPSQRWGIEGVVTLAEGKEAADIDGENPRPATSGYGLVDVLAYYRFGERVTVNAGFFNVTDRRYVRWVDTNGIGMTPDGIPADALGRFSQPGFNYGLNLRVEL